MNTADDRDNTRKPAMSDVDLSRLKKQILKDINADLTKTNRKILKTQLLLKKQEVKAAKQTLRIATLKEEIATLEALIREQTETLP